MLVVLGVQHYFHSYCIYPGFTHGFFSGSAHSLRPHFCIDFFFFGGGGGVLGGEVSAQWAWSVICSLQLRRHQQDTVVRVSCSVQAPALLLPGFPQLTHSIPLWLLCSVVPLTWGSVSYTHKSGCNFPSNVTGKPADRCTLLFYLHDPSKQLQSPKCLHWTRV